jgi:uncharacterized OB-fold protein
MTTTLRPVPKVSPESQPFWDGCKQGEFRLQTCRKCDRINWFPRSLCFNCGSGSFDWVKASGKATLETYSIVYRPMSEAWATEVPYTLAIVWLDEGIRMVTRLLHPPETVPEIGGRLTVRFVPIEQGFLLPYFEIDT